MADEPAKAPESDGDKSANQTREAAKWIVSSFAAVGAVLVGSASIKDLSNLTSHGKWQAVIGIAVALGGVLFVIVPFGRVLASARTSVPEITNATSGWQQKFRVSVDAKHYTILAGFPSLGALLRRHVLYQYERTKGYNATKHLPPVAKPVWVAQESVTAFENMDTSTDARALAAMAGLDSTKTAVDAVLNFAAAEGIRHRFTVALRLSVLGILLAGTGAVLFATAETTKDAQAAAATASPVVDLAKQPVTARLVINEQAKEHFAPVLGEKCDLSNVLVSVTSADKKSMTMLVLPQAGCTNQQIKVTAEEGHLESVSAVECTFDETDGVVSRGATCK